MTGWTPVAALDLVVRAAIVGWMAYVAIRDSRHGIIPNKVTGPVLIGVGLWQLAYGLLTIVAPDLRSEWFRIFGMLSAYAIIFGMWMLHFIGGGDAKFLMAMFALFPRMSFVAVMASVLLVITSALLVRELWGRPIRATLKSVWARIVTGEILPTERELQERGRRYAWTFAVPGIVYVVRYWDGIREYAPGLEYLRGLLS